MLSRRGVAPHVGWRICLCAGAALVLASTDASAAMRGTLATSVGLLAALVALIVMKTASAGVGGSQLLSAAGALLGLVAGAALLRRVRRPSLVPALTFASAPVVARIQHTGVAEGLSGAAAVVLPGDVDRTELLASARRHFVLLQAAWDAGDIGTLSAMTSPNMLEELKWQLPERGLGPNRTDVVTLHAELLAFEEHGPAYLASIEFSGMIRERPDEGAAPFRELWMLARSKDGASDWRLARQQALL